MSFANAAEALFTPMTVERSKLSSRKFIKQFTRWLTKLTQEAVTHDDVREHIAIAFVRSKMIQEFNTYMDLTEANCNPKYAIKMEEWEISHPGVKQRFKLDIPSSNRDHESQPDGKRSVTCYHCGKAGHMSRDCCTRLATEKQATPSQSLCVTHTQQQPTATSGERKPIICFNCQQVGHKSPNCPRKHQ